MNFETSSQWAHQVNLDWERKFKAEQELKKEHKE